MADGGTAGGWVLVERLVCQLRRMGEPHGSNGIVHRKGGVRARVGEMVLILGSMGTASYIGEGLGNPESFSTASTVPVGR